MLAVCGWLSEQEVKQRILLGTFSLSAGYADAYYEKSQQLRSLLYRDFAKAFDQGADVFVCPTAPTVRQPAGLRLHPPAQSLLTTPRVGSHAPVGIQVAYRLGRFAENKVDSYADDLFTVPASLAGLPAISVPVGNDPSGLPIGESIHSPSPFSCACRPK